MGREDHVVQAQQRAVGGDGLHGGHVGGCGVHLAGQQRFAQVAFVDQRAAGGVDEDHAVLHLRQGFTVDHAGVLRRQRAVQGDDVAAGVKLLQRNVGLALSCSRHLSFRMLQ